MRFVAAVASAVVVVGAGALQARSDPPRAVEIECGGYDADGRLVSAEAAAIEEVPVDPDGTIHIPPICGGYSEDRVFIGDV
ncbi:MAG: hypothetical protein M3N57_06205 [Actinomycetota bacterium]|nr:hypothetical protein [Actinomycetota bacterium]